MTIQWRLSIAFIVAGGMTLGGLAIYSEGEEFGANYMKNEAQECLDALAEIKGETAAELPFTGYGRACAEFDIGGFGF